MVIAEDPARIPGDGDQDPRRRRHRQRDVPAIAAEPRAIEEAEVFAQFFPEHLDHIFGPPDRERSPTACALPTLWRIDR